MNIQIQTCTRGRRTGFTLLEVLISIALVLLIILGVNQVFALTSQAVGAGNALSEQVRNHRSAQAIITADLTNAVIDRAPFFIINSEVIAAFRNRAVQVADLDYVATETDPVKADIAIRSRDRDGDGVEEDTPRALLTAENHRADMLRFFSRYQGRRQTGTGSSFNSWVASGEHYVVYGHLRQPDNAAASQLSDGSEPGMGTDATTAETSTSNPNNFYATQWILGRKSFLLQEPRTGGQIYDARTNTPVPFYAINGTPGDGDFSPFSFGSQSGSSGQVQWGYYDLMGVSIERYRSGWMRADDLKANSNWHGTGHNSYQPNQQGVNFRYTGYPLPSRPLTTEGVGRTVPCFVPACTQFIVEFAGDFMAQDRNADPGNADYGKLQTLPDGLGGGTDGEIDFNVTKINGIWTRTIRWYGFPRDLNRNGIISAADGDVVPLRDHAGARAMFERVLPTSSAPTGLKHYGDPDGVPLAAQYRCAWAADTAEIQMPTPRMIRIVMATDDPTARLANEQYAEFIVQLP